MEEIRFETDCSGDGMHLHGEMEFLYALQGRCAVFMEGRNFVLRPEDFAVFNPFETHQLYREEGGHTLSLYIPVDILTETGTGTVECISPLQPEKKVNNELLRMRLAELFRDYTENPKGRRLNIQAELLELLSILQQDFGGGEENGVSGNRFSGKNGRKQKILRYIWEHYREPLTLEQAAGEFYLSEGHFSRIFQEISGKSFSAYLRTVRLRSAKQEIERGNTSVTEIALSCGFGSVNTFIEAFRKEYGKTPGAFIRDCEKSGKIWKAKAGQMPEGFTDSRIEREAVSYMSLMRYRAVEKKDSLLHQPESEVIRANLSGEKQPLDPVWKKMIGAGYAKDILFEVVQRGLERGVREIGFEGFLLHGIFHDELGVCRRERDGSLRFNFAYMDIILDFLVEKLNVVPWIVLDYTPLCLIRDADIRQFGNHIMNLPENLEEWSLLIETVLKHMTEVYGKRRVSGWKFSMEQAMQVSVGNCGMEDYKAFYLATFQAIKSVLPKAAVFGFGLDTGFVALAGKRELEELLVFAKEKDCIPDLLSFQCFFCDYSRVESDMVDINNTEDEVYPMSENEDILAAELDRVEKIQKANGVEIPVAIMVSNPGMWGRNPGNDTCFRAAAFVKNAVENRNRLAVFASGTIPDYPEKLLPVKSMYHGGVGLLTYNGIPKAAYAGLQLLGSVRGEVAGEGKGYLLTCSPDRKEFYLLLYYYCPYDLARHRKTALSASEERNYDRYYEFEDKGAKAVHIFMEGLLTGRYRLETRYVNRESGSSYDTWMRMGAPAQMSQQLLNYLEYRSVFELYVDTANVEADGKMVMSVFLEPHEVRVIHGVLDENA